MAIIKGFTPISTANIIKVSDTGSDNGILENTDVYKKPEAAGGLVDVVNAYSWFSGGASNSITKAASDRIPRIMLVEKEQQLNSQLSQALYYLNATLKGAKDIGKIASKFTEYLGVDLENLTTPVSKQFNKITEKVKDISTSKQDKQRLESNYLRSLIGLYLTKDTGFKYAFPYFDNPPVINNSWGANNNETIASSMINTGMKVVEEISSFVNIAQPGVYIQKSKHFSFADEGPRMTIKFPLFNTVRRGDELPYQQNYELLWLLAYQNKPYKTSFARNIPPKIYDVTLPGVVNMPLAYISNLQVNFVGTVRNKKVSIAGIGTITAPIPDAYDVTIEVTSLISDYANLMIGSGFGVDMDYISNTVTKQNTTSDHPKTPGVSLAGPALDADAPENNPLTAPGGDIQGIRDPIVGQGGSADDGSRVFTGKEAIKQAQSLDINPGGHSGAGPTIITSVTVPDVGPIGVQRVRTLGPKTSTTSGVTPPVNNQRIVPGGPVDGSLLGSILNPPQ